MNGNIPCPHCNKPCTVPANALINVETYLQARVTVTTCCGRMVRLVPQLKIAPEGVTGRDLDDWGRKVRK